MISWISQIALLKLLGPADLCYIILRRSGPFSGNMQHNSLFRLLFCPDLTIAMLSWQVFSSIKPLQLIQNAAARLIFNEPKRTHVTPLFINLHWLPIAAQCIKFKALMFAYRTTSGSAPLYLNSLLQTYMPSRSLRSASERRITVPSQSERRITVPSQRDTKSLSQTFTLTVPIWWPAQLNPSSWILTVFKKRLKHISSIFIWPLTLPLSIIHLFLKN